MFISVIVTATIALTLITVFCVRVMRLDKRSEKVKSYVLVPCFEKTNDLEMLVKSAYWEEVFSSPDRARDIIILTQKGSIAYDQAQSLSDKYNIVHCVDIHEFEEFLKR